MAENEIRKICSDVRQKWPVKHIAVFHRLGYDFLYQFKSLSVVVFHLCTNSDSEILLWHPVLPWEGGSCIILADCAFKGCLLYCNIWRVQFSWVAQSCWTLWPRELQQARPPCPSPTPGVYSDPCPSSRWCHPTISSSVVPISTCPSPSQHLESSWCCNKVQMCKTLRLCAQQPVLMCAKGQETLKELFCSLDFVYMTVWDFLMWKPLEVRKLVYLFVSLRRVEFQAL